MAFVRDLDNLIPIMTSNTAPSGYVASASSEEDSGYYPSWKAFNGDITAYESWSTNSVGGVGWLSIQFPSAKTVNKYNIWSRGLDTIHMPTAWTFQGSNDGTTWTTLDTQSGISGWVSATSKSFTFSNTTAFTRYRINITASVSGTYITIGELELCYIGPVHLCQAIGGF